LHLVILVGYAVAMGMETPSSRYTQDSYIVCIKRKESCYSVPMMHPLSSTLFEPKCISKMKFIPTISSRDPTLNSESINTIRDVF